MITSDKGSKPTVIVVGGGIVGAPLAYRLAAVNSLLRAAAERGLAGAVANELHGQVGLA